MAAIIFHEPVFATIVESGDKLYFYEVGTTTDLTVYTDFALSAAATQPVVADSAGRFPSLYIDSTGNDPKVVLHDSDDVEKWTTERYPIEDIAALSTRVTTAESDIAALEGRMTDAETDIGTLETESADYESRIAALEGAGGSATVQIFTGDGTYTKPAGLQWAKVTVVGAGGGGVQISGSTAGGAGGGTAVKWIAAASVGATESVTVGTGGSGQSGSPGNAGGSSSFGSHCSATGGSGGLAGVGAFESVAGGVGSSGDINANGFPAYAFDPPGNNPGGASSMGGSTETGVPTSKGAGGASVEGGPGQDGADGLIIVEEFY